MANSTKVKLTALITYLIAEMFMIVLPNNLYICGSLFLLGHIILLLPYLSNIKIDDSFSWYLSCYILTVATMFIYRGDTSIGFTAGFSVYLFILTLLAYQTKNENNIFMYSTHLLFISDILLGINVVTIHMDSLIPFYGILFFLGIILLVVNISKECKYDKMLISKI